MLKSLLQLSKSQRWSQLLEGRWFDFPSLHVKASLGKTLKPKTDPDVLVGTLHGNQPQWHKISDL